MAGYSSTPLAAKLGIKEGSAIHIIDAPSNYRELLKPLPAGVSFEPNVSGTTNLVHVFETQHERLAATLGTLRKTLAAEATVWVSWPKKASKFPTTITENVIREIALPLGFVDVKVCAVTEIWSGLKLVVRKALR